MNNPQRYRLIHEFTLRDRADYERARRLLSEAIEQAHDSICSQPDYLALEKCDEPKSE